MPSLVMLECFSYMNPVILLKGEHGAAYYGVPRRAAEATTIIVHSDNADTVEALRRLEPRDYTVYASAGGVASRIAAALGYRVVEVMDEERFNGFRIVRGGCGLYVAAGSTLLAPPCEVSALYQELPRMIANGVERVVVSAYGAGVDAYLHRLGVLTGKRIMLVYCAAGWLGGAGTVLDVATIEPGEELPLG